MAELRIAALGREALEAYLSANVTLTDQIYNFKNAGDKSSNNVGCGVENIEEDPELPGVGNYFMDLVVVISTQAAATADAEAESNALEQEVVELLEVDDLKDQLSGATSDPFTVMGVLSASPLDDIDTDCWKQIWRRRVYCCASSL